MVTINNQENDQMDADTRDYLKKSRSFFDGWDEESFFDPMSRSMRKNGIGSRLSDIDHESFFDPMSRSMRKNGIGSRLSDTGNISNARSDLVEPLHGSVGLYIEENKNIDESFFDSMTKSMKKNEVDSRSSDTNRSATDSSVNAMEHGIDSRNHISNARSDLIEPLHGSVGFYVEENRKLDSRLSDINHESFFDSMSRSMKKNEVDSRSSDVNHISNARSDLVEPLHGSVGFYVEENRKLDESFFDPMLRSMKKNGIGSRLSDTDRSAADSSVDVMEPKIETRTRISNARSDLVEPLHESMGFYVEENRKLVSMHHREIVSLLRSIDEKMTKIPEDTSTPILGGLRQTYFNFTRMPVWTTIKSTYDFVLKPLFSGVKSLFFGSGEKDKSVLKELQRQTELARTGQINQERGFFQRVKEDGLLGMGAKGLTRIFTSGNISQKRAQDAANRKARGESMTMFDNLSLRFHKDIVLPDRERAMALIEKPEKEEEEEEEVHPEVPLLDNIRKNTAGILENSRHEALIIEGEFKRLTEEISALGEIGEPTGSVLDQSLEANYKESARSAFKTMEDNIPLIQKHTELSAANDAKDSSSSSSGGGGGGMRGIPGIIMGIIKAIPMIVSGLALLPLFKDVWDRMPMDEIKKIGSVIMTSAWDGLKIIWDGMNTFLPKIYGTIGNWFSTEFPGVLSKILVWLVTDGIPAALKLAVSLAEMIGNVITGTISGIFKAIGTLSSMAITSVGDMIGNAWDSVTTWVGDKITSVWDMVTGTVTDSYDFVTGIFSGFMNSLKDSAKSILPNRLVRWIFGNDKETPEEAPEEEQSNESETGRIRGVLGGIWNRIESFGEEPSSESETGRIRGVIDGIWNRIETPEEDSIGEEGRIRGVIDGIWNRIENVRGSMFGGSNEVNFDAEAFRKEVMNNATTVPDIRELRTMVQDRNDPTSQEMLKVLNQLLHKIPDSAAFNPLPINIDSETLAASMGTL